MPIHHIDIEKFAETSSEFFVVDVRSPAEYAHAHIPDAVSIPLFSNEERKIIGTAYKRESREKAVNLGLDFFSERMKKIPDEVHAILEKNKQKKILVHCWRGGMRSQTVAWLLSLYGHSINVLDGGYKKYRNWVLAQFDKKYQLRILGGFTGSGKTELLEALRKSGYTTIDLEALANHKGSAFGALGMTQQPSQEMFENLLAMSLNNASTNDAIWLEDESRRIGSLSIPAIFWNQMHAADLFFLEIPAEERVQFLLNYYGQFSKEDLQESILRLQKRLGGLDTQMAIQKLNENDLKTCFEILLRYYDKTYSKGLESRNMQAQQLIKIDCASVSLKNAATLIQHTEKLKI